MIHVCHHAAERWIERVNPAMTIDQAKAEIRTHSRAIVLASDFGAHTVKLGCGARLIVEDRKVVTVLAQGQGFWSREWEQGA